VVNLRIAPLSRGFMITAILGFLISAIYIFPRSNPWGLAFSILFAVMFVAAMVSTTKAPVEALEKKETK
jgi:multisubunit Na+/H+ antiporter MnhE subunit